MKYINFVKETIVGMDAATLEVLKKALLGEYISFSVISDEEVTKEELAEKLCDYFEKLEIKTQKTFDKQIETYIKDVDSIVESRIKKTPQQKKNDPTPVVIPRARKYYDKAIGIKTRRSISTRNLIDYSRVMFCLYTEIMKNQYREIDDLVFSVSCLHPDSIIESMKNEQDTVVVKFKKPRFDIKALYSSDTCTFIIAIILLYKIVDDIVEGEYYHE